MDKIRACALCNGIVRYAASALAALAAFDAFAVTFDGTGDWPTGGDVELVATVQVDDAHVAAVAGWQTLTISSGCRLNFVNTGTAATLAATVSGAGKVGAVDSVGLTISGDNRSFSGGFMFTNSAVTVANEYGLGGPSTTAADVYFTKTGTLGALDFQWAGQTAFTNHCPLKFGAANSYAGAKSMYLGSLSADTYFVQDADFTFTTANSSSCMLKFRNNTEFISGKFKSSASKILYTKHEASSTTRFSGSAKICVGGDANASSTTCDWLVNANGAQLVFAHSGGTHAKSFWPDTGTLVLEADGLFADYVATGKDWGMKSWRPAMQEQTTWCNKLDLNGHDALFHIFESSGVTASSKGYSVITSAVPATISFIGDGGGADNAAIAALEFRDKVSLTIDNNVTNHLARRVSSPDGTLCVKSGVLVYQWDGGWDGTAVAVDGGTIVANSTRAFSGGHSSLTMTGGKMVLSRNYPVAFATATVGGVELDPNAYTIAELRDDYNLGAYFEGDDDAELRVVGTSGTWTGWPTVAGATAQVPLDTTVYIHAADVANVSQLGKIVLGLGSTVICDAELSISCPITGYGTFRIVDSTGVTILGDNSKLVTPGCFYIENSSVAVSNRFGLGGAKTGAATVKFSSQDNHLLFGLADCKNFTNDVALVIDQTGSSNVAVLGSQAQDETFVQNADITFKVGTTYQKRVTYMNNLEFISGTFASSGHLYLYGNTYSTFKVGPGCVVARNGGTAPCNLAFYGAGYNVGMSAVPAVTLAPSSFSGFATIVNEITNLRLDAPDVFDACPGIKINYSEARAAQLGWGVVDLCGHDQTIGRFFPWTSVAHETSNPQYGFVTSSAPAVLTQTTDETGLFRDALLFTGAAGYCYAGAGTNLLCNVKSTSTGDFRVSSGVAGFDWGAAWAGTNIAVDRTGVLYVGADSAPAFGSRAEAKASGVTLRVNDGGRLYLESGETYVGSAYRGGNRLRRGEYTAANCDWIEGGGTLRVLRDGAGMTVIFR